MATNKDDILKAIEEMSVMDLVDLISAIEEKFGVTAAAAVAAAPAAAGGDGDAPAAEEKDAFDVVLAAAGDQKVQVINLHLIDTLSVQNYKYEHSLGHQCQLLQWLHYRIQTHI